MNVTGMERDSTTERTRMRKLWRLLPLAAIAVLALVAAGCGSGGGGSNTSGGAASTTGKPGGTVTIVDSAGSVDSIDPGYRYYQTDYEELGQMTQRWFTA